VPEADPYGRVIHFGVREHAMGAVLNGIALHGLTRAFGGTFLVFSDYMRAPVRLAGLMGLPSLFIWTHDSVGVGEDGPTHQPIEHLWALRAIPELSVVRPADANETAAVWAAALENPGPVGLILTRQNVPTLDRSAGEPALAASRGGYVIAEADGGQPQLLLLATGSEVAVALAARELMQAEGVPTRVVSLPCLEWFEAQPVDYREQVLPAGVRARVSVEAGSDQGWWKYVGTDGACVSVGHFGASAAADELFTQLGFTADNVASVARTVLAGLG
jgi:transketolase